MKVSHLRRYLLFQLYNAMLAAPRITKKSDPEILHKFRVAIRRTRSLLSLYLPECYALTDILKTIVQQTNEIRELDVFIDELNAEKYPLVYSELKRYRKQLVDVQLNKKTLKYFMAKLDKLYNDLLDIKTDLSDDELRLKAKEHYKRCKKLYNSLKGDEADELLHQLRIEFKIARYAFDFLTQSNIKNKKKKSLKCEEIQEHLGAIQDAVNQIEWLKTFYEAYPSKECKRLLKSKKKRLLKLKKTTVANQ